MLCRALDRAGLARYRVGLGDAALYPALLDGLGVPEDRRALLLAELGRGDFVGLEAGLRELAIDERSIELLLSVPQLRGGPDVLHGPAGPVADAVAGLRAVHALLDADVAARVIFDLGLTRAPGYYSGAVFEVYDPAVGMPIGGGGRYDHLLGQFGRELPAVGFALEVEKLHQALAAEERLGRRDERGGLAIAVPRGALFEETLDWLDRLGVPTAEVRTNERKLLFEDVGLITMRPSDVPTYVAAGAADIGITGKDVLMEQSDAAPGGSSRDVYELRDLGFGRCRMVVATVAGPDRAAEALRRLGVIRVATKYPRIAAAHFERTGRQVEIIEVKGSVELAPLTGLVEAIVDLTATGTTLRENNLVIREEIAVCTARLIANPVAHKLKAAAIDELLERSRAA